jgi:threonine dehydrogenase-like Zn-dependent dehydrogenase
MKELIVVGSRCGPFPGALALLRSGRADPRPLISGIFALKSAREAIRCAQRPVVQKVLVQKRLSLRGSDFKAK